MHKILVAGLMLAGSTIASVAATAGAATSLTLDFTITGLGTSTAVNYLYLTGTAQTGASTTDSVNVFNYSKFEYTVSATAFGASDLGSGVLDSPTFPNLSGFGQEITSFTSSDPMYVELTLASGSVDPWARMKLQMGNDNGGALASDTIYPSVAAVPLPASLPLLGGALGGLALFRRRRRRARAA